MNPQFWQNKKVFLTGHTGFKGSWLSLWLHELGAEVMGYALKPTTSPSLFDLANVQDCLHHFEADITDNSFLKNQLLEFQPDIIIHMAAQALVKESYQEPILTYKTNVLGTVYLLDAARNCNGLKVILNVTSDKCYKNTEKNEGYAEEDPMGGDDPYSASKGCSELVTASYRKSFFPSIAVASARAGNVIGGGDYITPRINGVKYFEKPPFFYWMQTVSYHAFGINEWSIRIPNALMGLLGVLLVYTTARKLYTRRTGVLSALILGTFGLYSTMAHMVTLDMSLSFFLSATFCCFILGNQYPAGSCRNRYMWAMYFFAALTTLTKGLIGIIFPCMIIFTWILFTGQWREIKTYCIPSGFLLLAIITVPWHVLVQLKNPEFFNFYFLDQQFLRYLTTAEKRSQPLWFLPAVLLGGMFPWTGLLFPALTQSFHQISKTTLFLYLWAGLIFLFFWISKSQLIPYVLPIYFPLSILLGKYLDWSIDNPQHWGVRATLAMTFLLCIAALIVGSFILDFSQLTIDITFGLLLVSLVITFFVAWKRSWLNTLVTLGLSTSLFFLSFNFSYPPTDTRSIKELAVALKPLLNKNDLVYSFHNYYQDLPVYLSRRVIMVDFYGEIWFGLEHTNHKGLWMTDKDFWSSWSKPTRQFMIMSLDEYDSIIKDHADHVFEIKRHHNNVLVSNVLLNENSHSSDSVGRS